MLNRGAPTQKRSHGRERAYETLCSTAGGSTRSRSRTGVKPSKRSRKAATRTGIEGLIVLVPVCVSRYFRQVYPRDRVGYAGGRISTSLAAHLRTIPHVCCCGKLAINPLKAFYAVLVLCHLRQNTGATREFISASKSEPASTAL